MSNTGQSGKNYGSIIMSALLSALLAVVVMSFRDLESDIEKLDARKANQDVVEVKFETIKSSLDEIKDLIAEHKK
jgi:hypothetical protein